MCEYIITEDFSMDKYIYDDKNCSVTIDVIPKGIEKSD